MSRFPTWAKWSIGAAGVILSPLLFLVLTFAVVELVVGSLATSGLLPMLTLSAAAGAIMLIRRRRVPPHDAFEA